MLPPIFRNRYIVSGIVAVFASVCAIGGYVGFQSWQTYLAKEQVKEIHQILVENNFSYDNCKQVLEFDLTALRKDAGKYIDIPTYVSFRSACDVRYNIAHAQMEAGFCSEMISGTKQDFSQRYILLDAFSDIQKECIYHYLTVQFSTGTFFEPDVDFKSEVAIDFSLPFYHDVGDFGSEEFMQNRIDAKNRLLSLLHIEPNVAVTHEDVVLYPERAILYLPLQPLTEYKVSILPFLTDVGRTVEQSPLVFSTPKNTYFGFKIQNPVSVYMSTEPPKFTLLEYDSGKTKTKMKICRIDPETYAKIEILKGTSGLGKEKNEYFKNGIDAASSDCYEKELLLSSQSGSSEIVSQNTDFDFDAEIGNPAKEGLYFVTFSSPEDRIFTSRVQTPVFFGIVDAHITMKVSRNGQGFFFVNDFSGKPLANQTITVYPNVFVSQSKNWNTTKGDFDVSYFSPFDTSILSDAIELGKTNADGILQVDLRSQIDDAFGKTFEDIWSYEWDGNYNSLFIRAESKEHLSYMSSKWNGGIAPWNFGYTVGDYWYGTSSENEDMLLLNRWSSEEPEIYTHIYTDRKVYLPGEDVYIKGVLRFSKDLTIPVGKIFTLRVVDATQNEVLHTDVTIGEFGSFSSLLSIGTSFSLGNYSVYLENPEALDGLQSIGYTGFSVEVFKNPTFTTEIGLKTEGLNEGLVHIDTEEKGLYSRDTQYTGVFTLEAALSSTYYAGPAVVSVPFTYKIYKQPYYGSEYFDECYYGCYWEPEKELYTEGEGMLDANGKATFDTTIDFRSSYYDYKYIVEVTVKDAAGDTISSSNSLIARLPSEYKRWNPDGNLEIHTEKRFYKTGEQVELNANLSIGEWTEGENNKYLLIIKKKDYVTAVLDDVRGYKRPVSEQVEKTQDIILVNDSNFTRTQDGSLQHMYTIPKSGEYIFEYGVIQYNDTGMESGSIDTLVSRLNAGETEILVDTERTFFAEYGEVHDIASICYGDHCSYEDILEQIGCDKVFKEYYGTGTYIDIDSEKCSGKEKTLRFQQRITADTLLSQKKYFTLIGYDEHEAENPVASDNKITILGEKISYHIGETARLLVRLPFSKGKVLFTVEKQGVMTSEYIDVPGNIFFKEIVVDDTFVPNAYIGIVAVDTDTTTTPEYKVGYTEIVVDKTDKKATIHVEPNAQEYQPRDTVSLDIDVTDFRGKGLPSELTVMVVDDSLISLMGNIDMNTLEKFYKKLPFQIQTSITNIAMLRNYYFSRPGIVGGSGFGNFKGGDSAVSSRNIFKNTAYYNPSVVTDTKGRATVSFELPDNLTTFRVMIVANSKDNLFGYTDTSIDVRKEVIVEDKTPLILRNGDEIVLGVHIFNTTKETIGFRTKFEATGVEVLLAEKDTIIDGGESELLTWKVKNNLNCHSELDSESGTCRIPYKITVLGDTKEHSDKLEGSIEIKNSPLLIQHTFDTAELRVGDMADLSLTVPVNTNTQKSTYELSVSNTPLSGIESIVSSLAQYPYGCIEQSVSSTLPNAILLHFSDILHVDISKEIIEKNLKDGIERLRGMQTADGGFGYWPGDTSSNLHITPYVLRSLIAMRQYGGLVSDKMIRDTTTYLEKNYSNAETIDDRADILWALAKNGSGKNLLQNFSVSDTTLLSRHGLLAYTYALVLTDRTAYKDIIESNIRALQIEMKDLTTSSYRYRDRLSDVGIFASLLMDAGYEQGEVNSLIRELYTYNWSSYYYSTQSKNNAFMAFSQFIDLYGRNTSSTIQVTLNGKSETLTLSGKKNIYTTEVPLEKVIQENKVQLSIENISGPALYISANINGYPEDISKVPASSEGIRIVRDIYEVVDANALKQTCNWNYSEYVCKEGEGLKLHTGDTFEKGKTYAVKLSVSFTDRKGRNNVTIEDYLPAGFQVLNSKFQTTSIATSDTTTDSWMWTRIENRPDVVMATAENVWEDSLEYTYFVTAGFGGVFTYPPATAYMMYEPSVRANTTFTTIEIQ